MVRLRPGRGAEAHPVTVAAFDLVRSYVRMPCAVCCADRCRPCSAASARPPRSPRSGFPSWPWWPWLPPWPRTCCTAGAGQPPVARRRARWTSARPPARPGTSSTPAGAPASRAVVFTGATRNSLVVLPLALALPDALSVAAVVVVAQTLVEVLGMVAYVRLVPSLVPADPAGRHRSVPERGSLLPAALSSSPAVAAFGPVRSHVWMPSPPRGAASTRCRTGCGEPRTRTEQPAPLSARRTRRRRRATAR